VGDILASHPPWPKTWITTSKPLRTSREGVQGKSQFAFDHNSQTKREDSQTKPKQSLEKSPKKTREIALGTREITSGTRGKPNPSRARMGQFDRLGS
jgi:hypothetical protein